MQSLQPISKNQKPQRKSAKKYKELIEESEPSNLEDEVEAAAEEADSTLELTAELGDLGAELLSPEDEAEVELDEFASLEVEEATDADLKRTYCSRPHP
ncbi:MAG: hypothetical protein R3C11_10960 [Planctomycetaceae bacterium]